MNGKKTCEAAVFIEAGKPLQLQQFELPGNVEPESAVCKVTMSTICGSDLHTISGKRVEPAPLILGHEIIGRIAILGDKLKTDWFGNKLEVGDRVSWSVMASCGKCFYCKLNLPQKCESLRKYGHTRCTEWPYLTGGYAEYIYLFPGTAIFKIPGGISDEIATPANCALSTVINGVETIGVDKGETVLIQGAGLLGLNLIALTIEAGAKRVLVSDVSESRLRLAAKFGADICLDVKELNSKEISTRIRKETGGYGVDVAFEVCGAKDAVPQAIESLRIGGRYLIAGLVTPNSDLQIDGNQLTRKCLTLKGIHNYRPEHLGKALQFLDKHSDKYPYAELVQKKFNLSDINEAVRTAASGEYVRVAIQQKKFDTKIKVNTP